jgi:hypothetical protein
MSADAERYVETLAVKGNARELLRAIAKLIPEGQTTTPVVRIADLAEAAQLHRRTVLKWVGELVDGGEITVMDGGRGKKARFTLVHLTGARPLATAPLPLRADLRPVQPRPRLDKQTPDLFDRVVEGEDLAIKRVAIDHTLPRNVWRSITRWVSNVWRSITRWPKRVVIDHTLASVLTIRARDVPPPLQERTTTTTAPPAEPPKRNAAGSSPCPSFGRQHAWCDGRTHVPMAFHLEERRKLPRHPGETDAELDDRQFDIYAAVLDAIPWTTDLRGYKNDFEFWREHLRTASAAVVPQARAPTPGPRRRPDIVTSLPCPHHPPCDGTDACVDRSMRKFG